MLELPIDAERDRVRSEIFRKIKSTIRYAEGEWGSEFDDNNTANDWVSYICTYATHGARVDLTMVEFEKAMLDVAGLAISALEAMHRNGGLPPRHYDSMPYGARRHPTDLAASTDTVLTEKVENGPNLEVVGRELDEPVKEIDGAFGHDLPNLNPIEEVPVSEPVTEEVVPADNKLTTEWVVEVVPAKPGFWARLWTTLNRPLD